MSLRRHARERLLVEAECDIREALNKVVEEKALTEAEALRVVNAACSDWIAGFAKYAIRMERHGDPEKPGGLAPDLDQVAWDFIISLAPSRLREHSTDVHQELVELLKKIQEKA